MSGGCLQKKTTTTEKKAKKGKGGPKRPLSAYMYFSSDWRERIKSENPDAGFGMHDFVVLSALRAYKGVKVRLASCWVLSGRSSMMRRKRYMSYFYYINFLSPTLTFQPYIEQAATDKARADREKAEAEVNIPIRSYSLPDSPSFLPGQQEGCWKW